MNDPSSALGSERSAVPTPRAKKDTAPAVDEAVEVADRHFHTVAQSLLAIWREVLKNDSLGIDDSFTEVGGGSLSGMLLLVMIEKRTGHRLQPRTLVTAPSVREQTELILRSSSGVSRTREPIAVAVQEGGNRPPLFVVPGYGDTLVAIRKLGIELGAERPLYILDPASFDPAGQRHETLAQLATAMIEDMRQIRPQGPYHLCGHSMGAHLIWEIACQLADLGIKPGAVVMLDSFAPGYPPKVARPLRWAMKIANAGMSGPSQLGALFSKRWQLGFRDLVDLPPRIFDAEEKAALGQIAADLERQWMATYRLCNRDQPRIYAGRVHLVRATIRNAEIGARDDDPQLGWGRFAPKGVTVLPIDSDHWQILEDRHAPALAALLKQAFLA